MKIGCKKGQEYFHGRGDFWIFTGHRKLVELLNKRLSKFHKKYIWALIFPGILLNDIFDK